jgi:4-amino-4-deoxy-L-arabinose transferase-like glycosyltransferase
MEVLGPTELAARLPAYLATVATAIILVWFARRRWSNEAGWIAGIAFLSMPLTLVYANAAIFDSTLALCTTIAILAFALERPTIAWLALGVGGLTKGPIALAIPLTVVVPYALWGGVPLRRLVSLRAIAAFALVALPWCIAVTRRFPEFPHYVFVTETMSRFATGAMRRGGPIWYYIPILPVAAFPWVIPACKLWLDRELAGRERTWLATWIVGPFVLLTLNRSKLPQYVLPLMPAFALAAGYVLTRTGPRAAWRAYSATAIVLAVAFLTIVSRMRTPLPVTPAEQVQITRVAIALFIVLLFSGIGIAFAARGNSLALAAGAYAVIVLSLPFTAAGLLRAIGDDRSAAGIATGIRPVLARDSTTHVLGVGAYPPSLPFYLQRTIRVATQDAHELTSNYIMAFQERYRAWPDSPLRARESWRATLADCAAPMVFVTRSNDEAARAALAHLPLLAADAHYAAYGPCTRGTH